MIGNRPLKKIIKALFQRQHYIALINMSKVYPKFAENLWRYLTAKGDYPYDVEVRTPVGPIFIRLYTHHDLLTVNEIFCRQDYSANTSIRQIVDIGSNIGVSALYFLTRNKDSKCYLYEPDPNNIDKLKWNLRGLEHRYALMQSAVSDQAGQLEFGVEPTGRYGGIGLSTGQSIIVNCLHINQVLNEALKDAPQIDILKIDTEGVEVQTVTAIEPKLLSHISAIYIEAWPTEDLHPGLFDNKQYGSVRRMTRKAA